MPQKLSTPGDTLVEVLFAVTLFAVVAVGAITIMNQGISSAQRSLEINLVRHEVDSQAELLRYLHDAKLATVNHGQSRASNTAKLEHAASQWDAITRQLVVAQAGEYDKLRTADQCQLHTQAGSKESALFANDTDRTKVFFIDPASGKVVSYGKQPAAFMQPATYAQVRPPVGTTSHSVSDMIWIQAVKIPGDPNGASGDQATLSQTDAYDFHIRSCWQSPGAQGIMKQGTIVRLYVPKGE